MKLFPKCSFRDNRVYSMDEKIQWTCRCPQTQKYGIGVFKKNHSFPLLKCIINAALMSAPSVFACSGNVWTGCLLFRVLSGCSSVKLSPCFLQCYGAHSRSVQSSCSAPACSHFLLGITSIFLLISTTDRALLSL